MKRQLVRLCGQNNGQALVVVAVLLPVLLGMGGLAVDFGSYAVERNILQRDADAIALAASQDLPDVSAVQATASSWAPKNGVNVADMTVTITQQNLPSVPNPMVKVTIQRTHSFTFVRLIGISAANVSASATAIRTSPGGSAGLMPWSVLQSVLNSASPGQDVVLKYDARGGSNGNFGALAIDGTGGSVYRDTIINGSSTGLCALGVAGCPYPTAVSTEPGNTIGPTSQGTDARMSATDPNCSTWAQVVNVNGSKMGLNPACDPFGPNGNKASARVIVVPIIQSLCNGRCTVTITGFALFFLEGYGSGGCTGNICEIKGRFIDSNVNYGAVTGVFDPNAFAHFIKLTQ